MSGKNDKTVRVTRRYVSAIIIAVLCFGMFSQVAQSAGTREMTATYSSSGGSWVSNSGYRPFTEWYDATTAGITRHQILKVYVNAGETLFIGSSQAYATYNSKNWPSILAYKPDGTAYTSSSLLVNSSTGAGYIETRAQELAGPNYSGSGHTGGYTPLSITVDTTGVWQFDFLSASGIQKTAGVTQTGSTANPNMTLLTNASDNTVLSTVQSTATVAAWDITVVKNYNKTGQAEVPGRVFANFLSLNLGGNKNGSSVLNSNLYVLTKDGYVYQTNFNGMDPYGFVFFANNRGLVSSKTNTSLYQSCWSGTNDMAILNTAAAGSTTATFQSPGNDDTALDSTYKIFFEPPSSDLPTSIYPTAYAPGKITNFHFVGDSDGHGYVGQGGYFYFDVDKASSYQIKIDMTAIGGGIVYLANACAEGENRVYWNGLDANGNIVPAGTYGGANSNKVNITVTPIAGEYHFPMLDVENNINGVKIRLLSTPLDTNGNQISLTNAQRDTVYYNNSYVTNAYSQLSGYANLSASDSGSALDQRSGFNTQFNSTVALGASSYGKSASYYAAGNATAIDIWSYFTDPAESPPVSPESFTLVSTIPSGVGNIKGLVFYDADQSKDYNTMAGGDYALSGVTVSLYNKTTSALVATTASDIAGFYSFSNITYGNYNIVVSSPYANAVCTTTNATQSVTLSNVTVTNGWMQSADVGWYFQKYAKTITVNKVWAYPASSDPLQPDSVTSQILGQANGTTYYTQSAVLNNANGWSYTFSGLPALASDGTTALTYTASENTVTNYTSSMTYASGASNDIFTFTNTPMERLTLIKTDSKTGNPLAGAKFKLYLKSTGGGSDTLITSPPADASGVMTTDSSGQIFVQGLSPGSYYFVETAAPSGYNLDPSNATTQTVTLAATQTDYSKTILVTNAPVVIVCSFTIEKKLSQASASDQQFVFTVSGPNGISYAVLTVPAGSLSTTQTFSSMPPGNYTVTENDANWRYSMQTGSAATFATDGTNTYNLSNGYLTMSITDPLNSGYGFVFTNDLTNNHWTGTHTSVTNNMAVPAA